MADLYISLTLKNGSTNFILNVSDNEGYSNLGKRTLSAEDGLSLLSDWDRKIGSTLSPTAESRINANRKDIRNRIESMRESIARLESELE